METDSTTAQPLLMSTPSYRSLYLRTMKARDLIIPSIIVTTVVGLIYLATQSGLMLIVTILMTVLTIAYVLRFLILRHRKIKARQDLRANLEPDTTS